MIRTTSASGSSAQAADGASYCLTTRSAISLRVWAEDAPASARTSAATSIRLTLSAPLSGLPDSASRTRSVNRSRFWPGGAIAATACHRRPRLGPDRIVPCDLEAAGRATDGELTSDASRRARDGTASAVMGLRHRCRHFGRVPCRRPARSLQACSRTSALPPGHVRDANHHRRGPCHGACRWPSCCAPRAGPLRAFARCESGLAEPAIPAGQKHRYPRVPQSIAGPGFQGMDDPAMPGRRDHNHGVVTAYAHDMPRMAHRR